MGKERSDPHRCHTFILNSLASGKGFRRYPFHNVVISSPDIAASILQNHEGTTLHKDRRINQVVGETIGVDALLANTMDGNPEHALLIREQIEDFFKNAARKYATNVHLNVGDMIRNQTDNIANLYERLHLCFVESLLATFPSIGNLDIPKIQKEALGMSRELGIKSILGARLGESYLTYRYGSKKNRMKEMTRWADSVVDQGFSFGHSDPLSRKEVKENLIMLLGAGTTSPAASVTWALYDIATGAEEKMKQDTPRKELTSLMMRSAARHPFGFVINRGASENIEDGEMKIQAGDTVWFISPPSNNASGVTDFGMTFSAGPRDCLGKYTAIATFQAAMNAWSEQISDFSIKTPPKCPIYYPTLKPSGMAVRIHKK